ncbi:MAG: potassium channel family protein [Antarcticimicrobium sp.]|uniref:potassium channel family protein n=1 Tax=Antarcticimicrobium sp. TaxID=2824147 RepID=UPI0026092C20|nr:potassium channel family protein [Antarcticimicrobium sp.]MDF1715746.1 potassium channel family protein [Antarcticimicrobium sp.]
MNHFKSLTLFFSLVSVLALGTVFFRYIEGWTWVDSYFFTVVTISTVGYGSLVPATVVGKIAATALIFVGLGIFAVAIHEFAVYNMRKREEEAEWLIARLGHHDHPHHPHHPQQNEAVETEAEAPAANEDDRPHGKHAPAE